MTDIERYLFDINGLLVLRNVLSKEEVQRLLDGIPKDEDGNIIKRREGDDSFAGLLGYDEPLFRDLTHHPRIVPYLEYLLANQEEGAGKSCGCFYLDHEYGLENKPGHEGMTFHFGGAPYNPIINYHVQDGQIYCGATTVVWCLTDVDEGEGGFWCLPGSHKAHFLRPKEIILFEYVPETVYQPAVSAGDVILFSEALTHGTRPKIDERNRIALFYKYYPGFMQISKRPREILELMTEEQMKYLVPENR